MENYKIIKQIGKGNYGQAYLSRSKKDNNLYVIKTIDISNFNKEQLDNALYEVNVLKSLNHPYIIKHIESFYEKNFLCIVMEYADCGDMSKLVISQQKIGVFLKEDIILNWFVQICFAVKYIHEQKREFQIALKEIMRGKKESHWIWYIFPQIKGLGSSFMCKKYDIQSLDEAKEYLNNDYLRNNLINVCKALLSHKGKKDIKDIMYIDDCKVLSCMTLFNKADEEENKCNGIFKDVMKVFFEGKEDHVCLA